MEKIEPELPKVRTFKSMPKLLKDLIMKINPSISGEEFKILSIKQLSNNSFQIVRNQVYSNKWKLDKPITFTTKLPDNSFTVFVQEVLGIVTHKYYREQVNDLISMLPEGIQGVFDPVKDLLTISLKDKTLTPKYTLEDETVSPVCLLSKEDVKIHILNKDKYDLRSLVTSNRIDMSSPNLLEPK